MTWLYAAPLAAAALHMTEEFVIPGGFARWDRRYRPAFAGSITTRFHVVINVLLLIVCYDVWALRTSAAGPFVWMVVAALLFGNAVWHVRGAWKTRSYSPGMVTGLILYLPLGVFGFVVLIRQGVIGLPLAFVAVAIGLSYPLVSKFIHRLRSRPSH